MSNNFLIHPQRGGRGNFPPQSVSESLMLHSKAFKFEIMTLECLSVLLTGSFVIWRLTNLRCILKLKKAF